MRDKDNNIRFSKKNKYGRGILCMLVFLIFMILVGMIFCSVELLGLSAVTDPDYDFYESRTFNSELGNAAYNIVWDAVTSYGSDNKDSLQIIDMGKKKIDTYNLQDIIEAYNNSVGGITGKEAIEAYRISSNAITFNLYDYDHARELLKKYKGSNTYLYMDSDTFVRFFERNGKLNTGHRYSADFSERAFFVFVGSDNTDEYDSHPVGEELAGNEEYVYEDNDAQNGEYTVETDNDSDVDISLIINEDDEKDIASDENGYAVYDPDQKLFYSTWDEYFGKYDSYTYSVDELCQGIDYYEDEGFIIDTLIFPMLRSFNYADTEFIDIIYSNYENARIATEEMKDFSDSAFLYYINIGDKVYSNVDSAEDITHRNLSYGMTRVAKGSDKGSIVSYRNTDELEYYDETFRILDDLSEDYTIYFGIDENKISALDSYQIVRGMWFEKYIASKPIWFIIGAGIFFILLVIIAVSLIQTTGRENSDDKRIKLISFDNICTELWGIICMVTLLLSAALPVLLYMVGDARYNVWNLYIILTVLRTALTTLPFGFAFMQLTLSFARRIKSHNLKSRSFIFGMGKKGVHWVRSKRGEERLVLLGMLYIGVQVIVIMVISGLFMTNNMDANALWLLILFFVVIWACTIFAIYNIISDIRILNSGINEITMGNLDGKVIIHKKNGVFADLAEGINHISDGLKNAVEKSLKDERMKTELITNVSHDLKTPLTSIINYINLLKSEKMPTPEAEHYVEVLDTKAQRLSQLTEDLVEAAKATSGNIELDMKPIAFDELMKQALGEFEDKLKERRLTVIASYPEESVRVMADGRRLYRILDNVLQNAYKYALEGTRIYADLAVIDHKAVFTMKNISAAQLNISADELMERFTRGDSSRTTEGSGLGLSIAKDLARLMEGTFDIELDGDLFKVVLGFPQL